MADCIIVFAKNPVPNQVKTRLLPTLSPEQAASIYRAFLLDGCRALLQITTAELVIAYTPPESRADLQALIGTEVKYIPQMGGGLGERLINAARWAKAEAYNRFVFVGSDSPSLPIEHVDLAFSLLTTRDVVLGPSMDGGYYLIGFSAQGAASAIPAVFEGVKWSTDVVFPQTLQRIQVLGVRLGLLPPWYDVDTPEALRFLRNHLFAMKLADGEVSANQTYEILTQLNQN